MGTAAKRLKKARKRRSQIARAFTRMNDSVIDVRDVLEDPSHVLKYVTIYDLLRRAPRMGPQGAKKILVKANVWPMDRVGDLSHSDRKRIIHELPPRATKAPRGLR